MSIDLLYESINNSKERTQPNTKLIEMPFFIEIWWKHYWYVIHSVAIIYPEYPNEQMKKKYYDFFYNLPLFLPNDKLKYEFADMLEHLPITPYLISRNKLIEWTHLIHNRMNVKMGKKQISFQQFISEFMQYNKPLPIKRQNFIRENNGWISFAIICFLIGYIVYEKKRI